MELFRGEPREGCPGWCGRGPEEEVSQERDILDAAELFAVMKETNQNPVVFVSEEAVDSGVSEMPNNVPPVPSIMRIHQVVSLAHGELIYRDVSCLCTRTQNLNCGCFNAKHFKFSNQ